MGFSKGFGKRDGSGNRRREGRKFDGGGRSSNRGEGRPFNQGFERSFVQREMHKTVCSDCGGECEVPFKPTEGRAVYCRNCYQNHKKF